MKRKNRQYKSVVMILFAVSLMLVSLPGKAFVASTVNLARTGQNRIYAAGDDGTLKKGVAWPKPRFTTNGDTTLTDNLTGLVWAPNGVAPTIESCAGEPMTWPQAFVYVACLNSINYLGHNDWRVPNINELESLVHLGFSEETCGETFCDTNAAWLNTQGFQNVTHTYSYWSSTTYAGYPDWAWIIRMYNCAGGPVNVNKNTFPNNHVWPVRGTATGPAQLWRTGQTISYAAGDDGNLQKGAEWPMPRFLDNGNGTVTDYLTGLVWLKNANCFGEKKWLEALDSANNLADGQCGLTDGSAAGDWRLPNFKELRSLVDHSRTYPALPVGYNAFTNLQFGNYAAYWSSTTHPQSEYLANVIWLDSGAFGTSENKTNKMGRYVWPVRDGQAGTSNSLVISKSGTGSGTVTSDPPGIHCGSDCAVTYPSGTSVTLTAAADAGSFFAGWSGGTGSAASCAGTDNCTFSLTANSGVTAMFSSAEIKDFLPLILR